MMILYDVKYARACCRHINLVAVRFLTFSFPPNFIRCISKCHSHMHSTESNMD